MHAPASDLARIMPMRAPSAPVMNFLRPSIVQQLPSSRQVVFSIDGSEPAPSSSAGSLMKNAERQRPSTSGVRNWALSASLPVLASKYILPSSGAAVLTASGPKMDKPDF